MADLKKHQMIRKVTCSGQAFSKPIDFILRERVPNYQDFYALRNVLLDSFEQRNPVRRSKQET